VHLEAGIAEDIHELTSGHAGLVCVCGRALERVVPRGPPGVIKLASWRDFRARAIVKHALAWPTMQRLQEALASLPADTLLVLMRFLAAGDSPLQLTGSDVSVGRYLAAEGWVVDVDVSTSDAFRMSSPLVRRIALENLSMRDKAPAEALPLTQVSSLDVPALISTALRYFSRDVMRNAALVSSKVPTEASYHSQLFVVLHKWLAAWPHATVFSEADTFFVGGTRKKFADMQLIGHKPGAPKHVLELLASANVESVTEHYARTVQYMAGHNGARGSCITFTAVADVDAMTAAALQWPSSGELRAGLEAIHVVHDVNWVAAAVFSVSGSAPPSVIRVRLE